jgi:peptide deformylase
MNGFYPLFLINPEIIKKSDELVIATEGCLSLPEQQIEMTRPSQVYIRFTDYHNNICELDAEGWLARVIQHEMDHLDGKLLIDYLTYVKRNIAIRKLRKLKNNYL